MLRFEGEREFTVSPAVLWAKVSEAQFLVECIPDTDKVTRAEADEAACVVRPGFAFVRGTLELHIRVTERAPDQSVRVAVDSKGVGTSSTVEAVLTLTAQEAGARLRWDATVTRLGGLLKAVPAGLIRAAANKIINDVWAVVDAKLKPG
jgi:carbon monoxide dehydrogenase subunit G